MVHTPRTVSYSYIDPQCIDNTLELGHSELVTLFLVPKPAGGHPAFARGAWSTVRPLVTALSMI